MKKYKHLLFDLDNTIWDFDHNSKESLNEVYDNRNLGRKFKDFEMFNKIYQKHNSNLWEQYRNNEISKFTLGLNRFYFTLDEVNVHDSEFSNKLNAEYLAGSTTKTLLIKDAFKTIANLSKKYSLHIITNGFFEVQFLKIRNSKIERFFTHIITSEECNSLKPNKEIFQYSLERIEATKEECILIGDNYDHDIIGAKNAGIDQVFFNRDGIENLEHKPTYEIKSLIELLDIF